MTTDRALEIITAYGADSGRWPADERAAVLALSGDAAVAAALAEARRLDGWIGEWAMDVPAVRLDADALIPVLTPLARPVPVARRWWAGAAALAAMVAAVLVVPSLVQAPVADVQTVQQSTLGSASAQGEAASADDFALVFTPTADEEDVI